MKKRNRVSQTYIVIGVIIGCLCILGGFALIVFDEIVNGIFLIFGGILVDYLLCGFAEVIQLLQDIKDSIAGDSAPSDPEEIPEI